jgi:hypothetical protein
MKPVAHAYLRKISLRTPDMAVVTPLKNFLGPEGDTVTSDKLY